MQKMALSQPSHPLTEKNHSPFCRAKRLTIVLSYAFLKIFLPTPIFVAPSAALAVKVTRGE